MTLKKIVENFSFKIVKRGGKIGSMFRIDLIKQNFLFIAIFLYFALYFGGIVNTLLESSRVPSTMIVSPTKDFQTWTEFATAVFEFTIGTLGIYFVYRGANNFNRRISRLYFVAGMLLLIITTSVGFWLLYIKYLI